MISAAQGRVQGRQPAAVIDIGSNSVRLVVYEGVNRSPTVLFNEKILCGLGKGLAKTGKLNAKAVQSALRALRRFRALADQAGAVSLDVLATAAAREAENGSQFIREAEALLKEPIKVLTGREEAYFSALGIISGFHDPDGIAGDLGGGSLELVDVKGRQIGDGITLPLGGLRLQDMSDGDLNKATELARKHLASAKLLGNGKGRTFYAVGGTWRNLAKLHMSSEHYALHVMHHYEIPFEEAQRFLRRVAAGDVDNMNGIEDVSKNRRALLAYGAIALLETIKLMRPAKVVFSALGVREGFLYSLLPEGDQLEDPLISAAEEFAVLRARSPAYARELAEWSGEAFAALGINETEDEKRYRRAACLVADISWRAHPDYRGSQALNMISNASFIGIDHPGRAYIALANFFRHEGISNSVPDPELAAIATPRLLEYSKILAGIMRITYPFSASMAGVVPKLSWKTTAEGLELVIDKRKADLIGDVPEGRLQQLARLTGKNIRMVIS